MKIYPSYKLRPRLHGEARVYELLSKIDDDHGFAVHSVNLPEHEYKRWGEADFVIVNRTGVTLLEIKGGTVSLAGREWRYENARGQAIISTEGPARQAMSAAVALEKLLTEHIGSRVRCRWGVAFPLCNFRKEVAELPPSRLANNVTCDNVGRFREWLENLPFDQHPAAEFALDDQEISRLQEILIPELSAATSLGLAVRSVQEEAFRLTDQQFTILESLDSNQRLCISGGAGTGKTELVALCAKAEKAAGRTPAIVTTGRPLTTALKSRMLPFGIPVVNEILPLDTDTLIVDEGQDYAQPALLKSLFNQLPGGLEGGRWRWFMDPNLQFSSIAPAPECLDALSRNAANVTLTRNVRSTREIVSAIINFLGADVGLSQIDGFGIRVGVHSVTGDEQELVKVTKLVNEMCEDGVQPSAIAVLGAAGQDGPTCRQLLKSMHRYFRPLSPEGRIESSRHGVVCAMSDFRGLEARAVILVDLHLLPFDHRGEALLYIGMSRASASLQLLVRAGFDSFLKELMRKSFKGE